MLASCCSTFQIKIAPCSLPRTITFSLDICNIYKCIYRHQPAAPRLSIKGIYCMYLIKT